MIEKTIYGISNALYEAFGEGYSVNTDDIEQGLSPPCFLIKTLVNERVRGLGDRYKQQQSFDVVYFPKGENSTLECAAMLSRLYDALEHIVIDGNMVWGTDLRGEIQDGVLHFFVDYNMFLMKQREKNNMEAADIEIIPKAERSGMDGDKNTE